MTYKKSFLILGLALLVQPVLSSMIGYFGAVDPYMVLGLMALLMLKKENAIPMVVACLTIGFCKDQLTSIYPGVYLLALTIVFILGAYVKERLNTDNKFLLMLIIIIATWLMKTIMWAGYSFLGCPYGYGFVIPYLLKYEIANLIFAVLSYVLLSYINKKNSRLKYYR